MKDAWIADEIRSLLDLIGPQLLPIEHETILDFVDVGEWALAVDTMCEQMHERKVRTTPELHDRLDALVTRLGLDDIYRQMIPKPATRGT